MKFLKGRGLWKRKAQSPQTGLYPYEALNEAELGLSYEGTFAIPKAELDPVTATEFLQTWQKQNIRCENWMRTYLLQNPACDWNGTCSVGCLVKICGWSPVAEEVLAYLSGTLA